MSKNQRQCLVCKGKLHKILNRVRSPENQEKFSIYQCENCLFELTLPQPKKLMSYYASPYYGERHAFSAAYCAKRRADWVDAMNQECLGGPGKLLDVGCGQGTFLLEAKRRGWSVAGIELNPARLADQGLDIRSSLAMMQSLAPFDCITFWHSLEHMQAPDEMLAEAHKLLAPNGLLFIAVPNAQGWQARLFGKHWLHRDVPRHLYHFGFDSLQRLLTAHKFEAVKWQHQEFEYDLLGWSQSMLNCLFTTPNIFFQLLTKRHLVINHYIKLVNFVGGLVFSLLALPLVPLAALSKAGGTLVVMARRR